MAAAWLEFPRGLTVWEGETLEVNLHLEGEATVILATMQVTGWMAVLDPTLLRLEPFRAALSRHTS